MVETENVPYGTVVQNDSIYSMSGTERRYERMVKRNSYSLMVLKDGTYRWYKKTTHGIYKTTYAWMVQKRRYETLVPKTQNKQSKQRDKQVRKSGTK